MGRALPGVVVVVVSFAGLACGAAERDAEVSSVAGSAANDKVVLVPSYSIGGSDKAGVQLGRAAAIDVSEDRVFILDREFRTVRVFTKDGVQIGTIGQRGQGPGEFQVPAAMAASGARLYVNELGNRRLHAFSIPDGELLYTKEVGVGLFGPMHALEDGRLIAGVTTNELYDDGTSRPGVATIAANGDIVNVETIPDGALVRQPSRVVSGANGRVIFRPPFEPETVWNITTQGGVMFGSGYRYHITIMNAQGTAKELVGPGHVTAAEVTTGEAAWHAAWLTAQVRRVDPTYTWDVENVAARKPYFSALFSDNAGGVWVLRPTGSRRVQPCTETFATRREVGQPIKCWEDQLAFDVFGSDGEFLRSVEVPPEALLTPAPMSPVVAIVGGVVWLRVRRDDGNEMIIGYELQSRS
jgi:hypothetical protein